MRAFEFFFMFISLNFFFPIEFFFVFISLIFFSLLTAETENSTSLFSCWFFYSSSGTIHKPFSMWIWKNWTLAVFFPIWMGEKKRPFHSNKSRPSMNPSVLQTVNCSISPSNFKWESRHHHQTLCVETKDVNPTHKRPLKKKYIYIYIYIYTHTQQLEYANAVI